MIAALLLCGLHTTAVLPSPNWHRAERRRRAKARKLLRAPQAQSPVRMMHAMKRLEQHHGSRPPSSCIAPPWQCLICANQNPFTSRDCDLCTYPMGYQKLTPQSTWTCPCWTKNAYCYRFCRACNGPFEDRIPGPAQPPITHAAQRGGNSFAPYLAQFPRCPLMPRPPNGVWDPNRLPVVTWRPRGSPPIAYPHQGQAQDGPSAALETRPATPLQIVGAIPKSHRGEGREKCSTDVEAENKR